MNFVKRVCGLLLLILLPLMGFAQDGRFDVRLLYESSTCVPKKVAVLIEVKASAATTSFAMGDATMRFDYELSDVINPVLKRNTTFSVPLVQGVLTTNC
jgi:6,7-dimethyl-8-ribityllumazine synthase